MKFRPPELDGLRAHLTINGQRVELRPTWIGIDRAVNAERVVTPPPAAVQLMTPAPIDEEK